jgi:hypothetical protein
MDTFLPGFLRCSQNLSDQVDLFNFILPWKQWSGTGKFGHNAANTEKIKRFAIFLTPLSKTFWSAIPSRRNIVCQGCLARGLWSKSKVRQFTHITIHKDVLGFDVAVDVSTRVQEGETFQNLHGDGSDLRFCQYWRYECRWVSQRRLGWSVALDEFVQVSVGHVLEDEEELLVGFTNDLLQLNNISLSVGT